MNMSLVLHLPREIYLCRSFSNVPRLPSISEMLENPHFFSGWRIPCAWQSKRRFNVRKRREHVVLCAFWLRHALRATTACTFSTSQLPKVFLGWRALYILTSTCTFWLRNVLRTTTACTFSTSQRRKVVRTWCALYILTSKLASRHNGVHFFDISTSKSAPMLRCFVHFDLEMCFALQPRAIFHLSSGQMLRTRRFSEPTFRPAGATNHWKYTVFRAFSTFSRTCIFFLLTLSLLWSSLFFSDSSHLCFSSCPYCRKFDF